MSESIVVTVAQRDTVLPCTIFVFLQACFFVLIAKFVCTFCCVLIVAQQLMDGTILDRNGHLSICQFQKVVTIGVSQPYIKRHTLLEDTIQTTTTFWINHCCFRKIPCHLRTETTRVNVENELWFETFNRYSSESSFLKLFSASVSTIGQQFALRDAVPVESETS